MSQFAGSGIHMKHCDTQTEVFRRAIKASAIVPDLHLPGLLLELPVNRCRVCDESIIEVPKQPELKTSIARALTLKTTSLSGYEISFLRRQLRYRSGDFARLLPTS